MLFRLNQKETESAARDPEPQGECGCLKIHLSHAAASLETLQTRCAFIGTFCRRCGSAYWTFLDSTLMSTPEEVHKATKTKRCSEAELSDIAYEWTMRAYHLGIPKNDVEVRISPIEALP
jgi:hypothetical protein